MRHNTSCRPRGFSLIELLVATSVIILLACLLIPAIMQARAAARRAMCQSNLRQWALGAHLYADTHHGRLPYRGQGAQPTSRLDAMDDWFNALPPSMDEVPYIDLVRATSPPRAGDTTIWICPDAQPFEKQPIKSETFFAYGMNMALSTPFMGRPDHIEKVGPQQTMVFMADGFGPYCSVLPSTKDYSPAARHLGSTVNIAFLDGHVEALRGEEVGCGNGDPQRPDIRWFPPNSLWPGPPK